MFPKTVEILKEKFNIQNLQKNQTVFCYILICIFIVRSFLS